MTVLGEAFIAIRPQSGGFEAELQKDVVPGAQRVAKTLATTIGGAFALGKIKDFVRGGIEEMKAAAAVQGQTAAAIKSTGGAANVTAEQVGQLAEAQMRLSGTDDELIQSGANKLLTFTQVRNEVGKGNDIFNQATKAALDLSVAGFGSMESASVLLGKALNDPVQGLTALQRVGVRLTDDQKNLVRELVATGDTLGAQKVILEEVNRQVGGSAEAYGKTLPGQLAIAQQSMENTRAVMLGALAPALEKGAGLATFMAESFAKQPAVLQQVEGGIILVGGAVASALPGIKAGIDLWRSFGNTAKAATAVNTAANLTDTASAAAGAAGSVSKLGTAFGALGIVAVVGGLALLASKLGGVTVDIDRLNESLADTSEANQESLRTSIIAAAQFGKLDDFVRKVADSDVIAAEKMIEVARSAGIQGAALDELVAITEGKRQADITGQQHQAAYSAEVSAAADATGDLAGVTGDLTKKQLASESASTRVRAALDKQRAAMDELLGTTQSAIGSQLDYADAQNATEDALAALNTLQADGKQGTEEYDRAVGDAARTLLGQSEAAVASAEAQAALAGKTLDASDKARIQQQELQGLADKLAPGSPLRRQLEGFIFTLGQVTPRHTTVTADTRQAQVEIQKVLNKLAEWDRKARALAQNPLIFGGGSIAARDHAIGSVAGGVVPRYATTGFGFPGSPRGADTVPVWAQAGEFMLQKSAVDRLGVGYLSSLNQGVVPGARPEGFTVGQLVVQGGTVEGAYATASEVVRQLHAEHYRLTGVT